jgi:MarR family transcriptional regulator, lower aerobic nicotinate degradation pathway regulator
VTPPPPPPGPPGGQPLARHTGYLLVKLGEVTLAAAERALAPLSLRARHFNVMTMIAADATLSQQDLSGLLGIDPTVMVALIDDLEHQGFLRRQRSDKDRRRYALQLTPAGQRALKQALHAIQAAENELLAPLNRQEADTLHELAGRLLAPHWPPHLNSRIA